MTPTVTLRTALAAYDPARPRWQQQRQYGELRTATETLRARVRDWEGPGGKLDRMWAWLEANKGHPEFAKREEAYMDANERYKAARDLLGEAEAAVKGEA